MGTRVEIDAQNLGVGVPLAPKRDSLSLDRSKGLAQLWHRAGKA